MSFKAHAQFFGLELDSVNPYVTALPYPMDGNYRVLSYDHRFPAVPVNRTRIKVYNTAHQLIKTIHLLRGITLVNDYPPLLYNKRLLWPANYNDTVANAFNSLAILELDTAYGFVALHKLSTHGGRALPTGIVGYSNGFVVGEYFNGPGVSSSGYSTKLYKLTLGLQKKDSALFVDELRLKTHDSKNNRIIGASENLSPSCTPTAQVTQKIVLDTNLAIADCFNIPAVAIYFCYDASGGMIKRYAVRLKQKGILFPLSNYRTYIHGEADNASCLLPGTSKAITNLIFKGNTPDNSYLSANNPEDTEFPLYQASDADYYGSNTISVGTIGLTNNYAVDKNFYRPYFAKPKTRMVVTKLDTLGNLVWSKQFGGDMNYFARSVAFTADGGCIVAGSNYDSTAFYQFGVFQNFLMKLDSSGNLTTPPVLTGITEALKGRVSCYPNPASGSIYFDVPSGHPASLEICNSLGELVLQQENISDSTAIPIESLNRGIYACRIRAGENFYTAKFVKE